jgi:AcrR family transcriptional regulator
VGLDAVPQDGVLPRVPHAGRDHEGPGARRDACRVPGLATRPVTSGAVPASPGSILAVARRLFYERGFDATSMQDIANATGLHKSSLYHHFRSKDELLEQACQETFQRLRASLAAATERDDLSPRERLLAAFDGAAAVALDDVAGTNVIISQREATKIGKRVHAWRRDFDRAFASLVRDAQAAGEVRADVDAALLTRVVLGTINWIVTWYRPGVDRYPPDEVRRAVTAVIDHGV